MSQHTKAGRTDKAAAEKSHAEGLIEALARLERAEIGPGTEQTEKTRQKAQETASLPSGIGERAARKGQSPTEEKARESAGNLPRQGTPSRVNGRGEKSVETDRTRN